jgi:hypothetical protein
VLSPPSRLRLAGFVRFPSLSHLTLAIASTCWQATQAVAVLRHDEDQQVQLARLDTVLRDTKSFRPADVARARFLDGIILGRLIWRQDGLNVLFT